MVSQSRFSFHFQRIFPPSEEGREGSCILSLKSPAYPAPTEMRMSGKSSEYWSSSPTPALLVSHFHFSHKSIPGGRGRFSFVEVIGGGGKEELCRDLFCFSAPRLLAIGEKQDNGRRAADQGAWIILRVSYLSSTRCLYLSPTRCLYLWLIFFL